jgi:hypothetical protein
MGRIHVAQGKVQWIDFLKSVMHLRDTLMSKGEGNR